MTEIMVKKLKILTLFTIASWITLISCTNKKMYGVIRNDTKDTLVINVTEAETYDEKVFSCHQECIVPPDSSIRVDIEQLFATTFGYRDTCYVYAIKLQHLKDYTPTEINKKHLYEKRAVTPQDFRTYEYIP